MPQNITEQLHIDVLLHRSCGKGVAQRMQIDGPEPRLLTAALKPSSDIAGLGIGIPSGREAEGMGVPALVLFGVLLAQQ